MSFCDVINSKEIFKRKTDNYAQEQAFSEELDATLGLTITSLEQKLIEKATEEFPLGNYKNWGPSIYDGNQAWIGLSIEQLQTTYSEFYDICSHIIEKSVFSKVNAIDLGAAYGRLGFVLPAFFNDYDFKGYEIVKERVEQTNSVYANHGLRKSKLFCQNVLDDEFDITNVNLIFVYDIGEYEHIKSLLSKVEDYYDSGGRFYLVARGRGVNGVISKYHPWMLKEKGSFFNSYQIFNCL